MKKTIKYSIPFFLLFCICNGMLFNNSLKLLPSPNLLSKTLFLENTTKTSLEPVFSNQVSALNLFKQDFFKKVVFVDNEEEDIDAVSAKKCIEKTRFFSPIHFQQITHLFCFHFTNSLFFSKVIFQLKPYQPLYILFEVFRI